MTPYPVGSSASLAISEGIAPSPGLFPDSGNIVPSDTVNFVNASSVAVYCRYVKATGTGDVVLVYANGTTETFSSLAVGDVVPSVPMQIKRVNNTSTTATVRGIL